MFLQNSTKLNIISLFALFITAMIVLAPSKAHADYKLCNLSSYTISAAVGLTENDVLVTRGWGELRAGECDTVIKEKVKPGTYYIYAEAIAGHDGPQKTWSGDITLCVDTNNFFNLRDQTVCHDDPRQQRRFFEVVIPDDNDGSYKTDFVEENVFNTVQAEIAGVQRLLKDIGYTIPRIDGSKGKQTSSNIRAYRKKKGMGESSTIDDDLMSALIDDAFNQDSKKGFFFCNMTQNPVWAAFAAPKNGRYTASGWWRLGANDCTRVKRGALTGEDYYVYGVMDLGDQDWPMVGGDKPFCIADVMFSSSERQVGQCKTNGYEQAMFKKVSMGNERSWTYKFTPEQFNPELR